MSPLAPGQEVEGYRLIRLLGRGGMGEVYLAKDTLLERLVAVKFISAGQADEMSRRRFLQEARAVARFQHPNVVTIFRVGEYQGQPYLVSEYVPGKPLDMLPKPVDPALLLEVALKLSCGLAVAHRRGVVHRDIKPANAILSEDGEVKLLDFGIAKLLSGPVSEGAAGLESPGRPPPDPAQQPDPPPPPTDRESTAPQRKGARAPAAIPGPEETAPAGIPEQAPAGEEARSPEDAESTAPGRKGARVADGMSVAGTVAAGPLPSGPGQQVESPLGQRLEADAPTPRGKTRVLGALPLDAAAGALTAAGSVMGTPQYMAPELWAGGAADFRSDIYSLGALLYHLATGRPPHLADTLEQLGKRVQQQDPRAVAAMAPRVSPRLAAVIHRCLARDPARRFATGNDLRAALVLLTPAGRSEVLPEGNPYRGLSAFEAEHRNLFFGRDSEIRLLMERLAERRFVLVAGDSGVGKSSFCRAGVLPRVGQWSRNSRRWSTVSLVPGRQPLTAMGVALAPILGVDEQALVRDVEQDPGGVWRRVRISLGQDRGLLLFFDQLEELVTLSEPDQRDAVARLLSWLAQPVPGLRLLATARGDFLSRLSTLPGLGEAIPGGLFFLWPLSSERIREAIEGPARAMGVRFESAELVDSLVRSAEEAAEGGALPLLQFTLSELWEARGKDAAVITGEALEALGGVDGALSRHADRVLEQMTGAQREAACQLLLRLVSAEGTRVRRGAGELQASEPARQAALSLLVAGRLVVAREEGFDLAHEALIRGWDTLVGWLSSDAEARRVAGRLSRAVAEWERLGRRPEALYSPLQLRDADRLAPDSLGAGERAFLAASRREQRRSRLRRLALMAGVPLLLLTLYAGLLLKARLETDRRVDARLAAAQRAMDQLAIRQARSEALRVRAMDRFRHQDPVAGEDAWARHLAAREGLAPLVALASRELEGALLLDQQRAALHKLMADLLFRQALMAEERRDGPAFDGLLERLALYDADGSWRARLASPGRMAVTADSSEARLTVTRYQMDGRGRLSLVRQRGPADPRRPLLLPRGSYLALVEAPGRSPVRQPFFLERGETLRLDLALPPSEKVPEGYLYIPPGRFLFGSAAPEGQRRDFFHHVPLHARHTGGYLVARLETTFGQWLEYIRALPAAERAARLPGVQRGGFQGTLALEELPGGRFRLRFSPTTEVFTALEGEKIRYPGRPPARAAQDWLRLPVVGISAADAGRYTAWLSASGRLPGARLCTGLEWERAARGADGREYPHGDSLSPDEANIDATYGKVTRAMGPDEVGSYPASRSPFGVDDMAGNVWEWTTSSLRSGELAARGGSWYFGAVSSRVTDREITEPAFKDASVGMRVCADFPASTRR